MLFSNSITKDPLLSVQAGQTDELIYRSPSTPRSDSGKTSFFGTTMNVVNGTMGAGVLLFPNQFARLGLAVGVSSLFIAAVLMVSTLHIIGKAGHISNATNFQKVVKTYVGKAAGKGTSLTITLYTLGTCTSYLILIADQIETLIKRQWLTKKVIILITAALLFPLIMMPNITWLSYTSTFGVAAQCYTVGCVWYHCVDGIVENGIKPSPIVYYEWTIIIGQGFALYTFALQCHHIFIPVVSKLKDRTQARVDGVAVTGICICTIFNIVTGVLGYLNFGDAVVADVLAFNLPNTVDVKIARIAIALKCLMAYPLLHFAARMSFADLLGYDIASLSWRDAHYPRKTYLILTMSFLSISVCIAVAVDFFDVIVDFNGAVFGVFQTYFWPAMLYYFMQKPPRTLQRLLISSALVFICFTVTFFDIYCTLFEIEHL